VNADIKRFVIGEDGVPELYEVDTDHVGMTISTKSVGSWRRDDITNLVCVCVCFFTVAVRLVWI